MKPRVDKTRMPRSLLTRYGGALLAFVLPLAFSYLLGRWHINFDPTWALLILLIIVSWFAGRGPGLLFALLLALLLSFYSPPPFKLKYDLASFNRLALFTALAMMTSARRKAEEIVKIRARQQAALAQFGLQVLTNSALSSARTLFDEATALVAKHLDVEYVSVWELPLEKQRLSLRAGVGWEGNDADRALALGDASLASYVVPSQGPLVITDLHKEMSGPVPLLLREHRVVSGVSVFIPGVDRPSGVLSAHTTNRRKFTADDLNFLQAVANTLAEALERHRRENALHEGRELLRVTLGSIGDAVITTDVHGRVSFMNAVATTLTGWTAEEAIGKSLTEFFHLVNEHTRQEVENPVTKVLSAESVVGPDNHTVLIAKDGTELPIDESGAPIRDAEGQIVGIILIFRDVTRRKQSEVEQELLLKHEQLARAEAEANEQRFAFLAQASEILSSSLDYEATLKSVAHLAVPLFADWCRVDVLKDDGEIQRVAVAHQDLAKIALAEEIINRYPNDPGGLPLVLRTGEAAIYPEVTDAMLEQGACDAEHLELLRKVGIKSVMIVPLVARERTLGAITFVSGETDRIYSESDLNFAQDLADRAALAVDNARLYYEVDSALHEREQALQLHRGVEERLSVLVEASDTILGSMQLVDVQQAILDVSGRLIAADAYAIWRREPDRDGWRVVTAIGLSDSFQETGLGGRNFNVSALKAPLAIESVQETKWLKIRHEAYRLEGIESLLIIPLKLRGEFAGTIAFYYHRPTQFSETEIRVATALANLAAAAISTTELYLQESALRDQAVEANRLKDEFLATLSHELRNPLNSIAGYADILLRSPDARRLPMVQKAAETIRRNAMTQARLINDLLDLSRLQTGKLAISKQPVRFSAAIGDAINSMRLQAAAKSIRVDLNLSEEALIVEADPVRLQQVVWNLVSNAVKFTPIGGQVAVGLSREGQAAVLKVEDNGQGIDEGFLPYVFEMFRQADARTTRSHGGMGIGLALVKQIIEHHGGSVQAESEGAGKGTCMTVRLPLYDDVAPSLPATPSPDGQLNGARLLVVDDTPDSIEMMRSLLEIEGASVTAVLSGAEALEAAEHSDFELLISDISMPGMDGYELIRRLREQEGFSDIPAIAITGFGRDEDIYLARAAGFTTHLTKPLDFRVFLKIVNAALHRRNGKID
jgi:PAS domain S-box-containing protein